MTLLWAVLLLWLGGCGALSPASLTHQLGDPSRRVVDGRSEATVESVVSVVLAETDQQRPVWIRLRAEPSPWWSTEPPPPLAAVAGAARLSLLWTLRAQPRLDAHNHSVDLLLPVVEAALSELPSGTPWLQLTAPSLAVTVALARPPVLSAMLRYVGSALLGVLLWVGLYVVASGRLSLLDQQLRRRKEMDERAAVMPNVEAAPGVVQVVSAKGKAVRRFGGTRGDGSIRS